MHYKILFTDSYNKKALRFFKKYKELFSRYEKVIKILERNPFHPSLRLHKLSGKLDGLHSVSINMSYRITIVFIIKDKKIIPVNIGSHDEVYT